MIWTVSGEIDAKELGITMCHEHLALDLSPVRGDEDSKFDEEELITSEVEKMTALGVKSVIEVTCNDMGRDVLRLRELSQSCHIQIVASTGYYLEEYHSDFVRNSRVEELCELFCKEILEGIGDTGIRAGVIGEVATGAAKMAASEEKVLIAAAMAAKKTGCAVTTHCQLGRLGMEQSALFHKYGMNPAHVVLGHLDLANDCRYYEEVLRSGVNIGFDTIGKTAYLSDEVRADNLMWLLERGYENQLVLSQDISRKSYLSKYGKHSGYMTVMKDFVPLLLERGILRETLTKLLVDNPARIFDNTKGKE